MRTFYGSAVLPLSMWLCVSIQLDKQNWIWRKKRERIFCKQMEINIIYSNGKTICFIPVKPRWQIDITLYFTHITTHNPNNKHFLMCFIENHFGYANSQKQRRCTIPQSQRRSPKIFQRFFFTFFWKGPFTFWTSSTEKKDKNTMEVKFFSINTKE